MAMASFNPRTHTGCDVVKITDSLIVTVSIHAPTRGATRYHAGLVHRHEVSIHAPTRGATTVGDYGYLRSRGFNPRTHTGCDFTQTGINLFFLLVSIHAPTRGATNLLVPYPGVISCFNPRTHTGCDMSFRLQ